MVAFRIVPNTVIVSRALLLAVVLGSSGAAQEVRSAPAPQPPRIGRLVGVFDLDTGTPLEGVRVLDMRSRWSAMTTNTGTLALSFVDTMGSLIQVAKLGYETQRFYVANSDVDTAGITVLLKSTGQALPTVVTRARGGRGPADTVRALELNGFYERRTTSGAPEGVFLTAEKIGRLRLLEYLPTLSGRPICTGNLYLNGSRVLVLDLGSRSSGVRPPTRNLLDAMLLPSEVLAIEMYKVVDTPAKYQAPQGARCGATLVWTK